MNRHLARDTHLDLNVALKFIQSEQMPST